MIDFFDEDFPLTKKQEEEAKRRLEEEKLRAAEEAAARNGEETAEASPEVSSADEDIVKADEAIDAAEETAQAGCEPAASDGSDFDFNFPVSESSRAYEPERELDMAAASENAAMPAGSPDEKSPSESTDDYISQAVEEIEDSSAAETDIFTPAAEDEDSTAGQEEPITDDSSEEAVSSAEVAPSAEAAPSEESVTSEEAVCSEETVPPEVAVLPQEAISSAEAISSVEAVPSAETEVFLDDEIIEAETEEAVTAEEPIIETVDEDIAPYVREQETDADGEAATPEPEKMIPASDISREIEEAVSSAINHHMETFIKDYKPSGTEADKDLREELSRLRCKLDNVEKAVGAIEVPLADESDDHGFSYEYDERYFAEEETPAYKYPGLYKKNPAAQRRTKTAKASKSKAAEKSESITLNTKTLLKMGAMVAATAAAVKLLGKKDD